MKLLTKIKKLFNKKFIYTSTSMRSHVTINVRNTTTDATWVNGKMKVNGKIVDPTTSEGKAMLKELSNITEELNKSMVKMSKELNDSLTTMSEGFKNMFK